MHQRWERRHDVQRAWSSAGRDLDAPGSGGGGGGGCPRIRAPPCAPVPPPRSRISGSPSFSSAQPSFLPLILVVRFQKPLHILIPNPFPYLWLPKLQLSSAQLPSFDSRRPFPEAPAYPHPQSLFRAPAAPLLPTTNGASRTLCETLGVESGIPAGGSAVIEQREDESRCRGKVDGVGPASAEWCG
ncbi:hypothetical protein V494_03069 [Pseudogymnoascus sp. VKM F-4513 (FW-928)]|nr:hypothetical protein V494_03069 [Pseudogymnoascus sp. VKM F-4513 (FW-928)]